MALGKPGGKREPIVAQDVCGRISAFRVDVFNERSLPEKQAHATESIEFVAEARVGEHGEIRGDKVEVGARFEMLAKKSGDAATSVVVANA